MTETATQATSAELTVIPFELIRAEDLAIPDYQPDRRAKDGIAQNIIENFDPEAIGVLLVSERDGKFWVMDGQRRRAACLAVGYPKPLPCYVFHGFTYERESRIWSLLDVQSPQHIVDRYKGMVSAGFPRVAVQIEAMLRKQGYSVAYDYSPTTISAVKVLETIYVWGSLPTTLAVIRKAWQGDDYATLPNILMALGAFDAVYRECYLESTLAYALQNQSPQKLVQDAQAQRREGRDGRYVGSTLWATVAIGIRRIYNQYMRQSGVEGRHLLLPEFRQPAIPHDRLVIARPNGGMKKKKDV